jgi:tRNA uridine 5-carboxymethylaminomethyl modification enzyme
MDRYDVIVVGGGHAGSEAAYSAATMGCKVLLVTMDIGRIAQMSCNPAIGGIAKGQIVREIDALGGMTGIVTDISSIQFRLLNRSKGPAMWSPRSQCDRNIFSNTWRDILEKNVNVDFWQDKVVRLIVENDTVVGVECGYGLKFHAKAVILTTGTFENGLMHIGSLQIKGGRVSEGTSTGISHQLKELGFEVGRMKTGTPARIDARSVDFSGMVKQGGDDESEGFSFYSDIKYPALKQRDCYIAYTNPEVHEILASAFDQSPLFNGTIKSIGPRYCPSIEDKVVTFSGKDRHQLFLEPEGENTVEYYINGFSSSLPLDIQIKALRKVKGLENVKIFRPGYAIEYDYYPPTQIKHTLETKFVNNLYFAGQINGTTGYEEAAAQGLMAGINAVRSINGEEEFVLRRDQAYIGVLIDDLVTKGVDEPYRMFTSRAEYRILLRHDNADTRLSELGFKIGLLSEDKYSKCIAKHERIDKTVEYFNKKNIKPETANPILESLGTSPIKESKKIADLIGRPQVSINNIISSIDFVKNFCDSNKVNRVEVESAEILTKYKGYITRERNLADKIVRLENLNIPDNINYDQFVSISTEGRQKLGKIRPKTIGQASRISGISPSDISVLLVFLGR